MTVAVVQATPDFPGSVLGVGAWLKNAACLLDSKGPHFSAVHGDLSDPVACTALAHSVCDLARRAAPPIQAIVHDLHPDFYSTRLALALADKWQVKAIGVQHHHAHIGAVMAEHGLNEPVIGLALDGAGLGTDGAPWGGELLAVSPAGWERLGHVWPLALPGGDAAAREPWRMLASALHSMDRAEEIESRLMHAVQPKSVRLIHRMLDQRLNSPHSTSAGRWFDAAAAALGLHLRHQGEAQAAMALEAQAASWLGSATGAEVERASDSVIDASGVLLDLRPLISRLLDWPDPLINRPAAAGWFHLALARALADWAASAGRRQQCRTVCLGGGCFMNGILTEQITLRLQGQGFRVFRAQRHSCGDAALALGQAWVAARQLHLERSILKEEHLCA